MNKKTIAIGIIGIIVIIGAVSLYMNSLGTTVSQPSVVVNNTQPVVVANPSAAPAVSQNTVPLMQSTGALFSQYKYFSKAHEIFPTLAADAKAALGAFTYTKVSIGNNIYRFTLVNNAEGYKGQSVVVSGDQSVYFIEPAKGDDSASEDSITTDDSLLAVDAQGYILK